MAAADTAEDSQPGLLARTVTGAQARLAQWRERWPLVDHAVRAVDHMIKVQGTILAGAVTYYGYLSVFPVLVIAFSVVSYVAVVVPEARDGLVIALESIFPDLIGTERDDPIKIQVIADRAGAVSFVALAGLLYSGLGWISAARAGLQGVFLVPPQERRNFLVGKVFDLLTLALIGTILLLSVGLSSAVTTVTREVLVLLQFDEIPGDAMILLLKLLGVALGVLASTVLFFAMFTLLTTSDLPRRAVLKGAFLAALGFEILKLLASLLIGVAADNPATAILGTSLVLLVWINYFSRVVLVGAAWAYTSPEARLVRERRAERQRTREELARRRQLRRERYSRARRMGIEPLTLEPTAQRRVDRLSVAAGALSGATATALAYAVRHRH
jgi:membrane protein